MIDETDTLRRYVEEKSDEAFAEFVRHTVDFVYSAALRRTNRDAHAAADVAQLVFISAARNAPSLTRHPCMTRWLYSATRNAALNHMRDEHLRQQREREAQTSNAVCSATADDAEWERIRPMLDAAMDDLSESDREAVLLRFFQERTFVEMGRRWQLTENGARMRVERALEKLRRLLAQRGITSTSAALGVALAGGATVAAPAGLAGSVTGAALASSAGGISAVTLLQFMSTTKFLGGATAALALLAIGTVGVLVRSQRQHDAALGGSRLHYAAQIAKGRDLERRAQAAERRVTELKQSVAAAEADAAAEAARAKAAADWNPAAEGKAFMQRHPEMAQAYLDWSDSSALFRFDGFIKARGLTAAQIDRFKFLMRTLNLGPISRPITSDGKSGQLAAEGALPQRDASREMRALLGDEGYKAYNDWWRTKFARDSAHMTAGLLCFTEAPLTREQAERIEQIITPAIPAHPNSAFVDWDAVDMKMKAVVSSDQWFAWESVSALGRAGRRQREASMAEQAAQKATTKPPSAK